MGGVSPSFDHFIKLMADERVACIVKNVITAASREFKDYKDMDELRKWKK
jgi:hypothetical protein